MSLDSSAGPSMPVTSHGLGEVERPPAIRARVLQNSGKLTDAAPASSITLGPSARSPATAKAIAIR